MAIYRLFPNRDSFISTQHSASNAGRDEILEISGYRFEGNPHARRALIAFSTSDIQDVVNNKANHQAISASLKMFLAEASELPASINLECFPVAQDWDNGLGKYGDWPHNYSGVSWLYRKADSTQAWTTTSGSLPSGATFRTGSIFTGGGNWYTGSSGLSVGTNQTHEIYSTYDLDFDITNAITLHYSGSLTNNGFIVMLSAATEFVTSSSVYLKYFGRDTHTIYPPCLDIKWSDYSYSTGSNTTISSDLSVIKIKNNRGIYKDEGKQRFRVAARPRFPTRTFTTSSIYKTEYYLPVASYWGLKDEYTEEMVFDFDTTYTKISADTTGNFFDMYMDGLQPERYYRILIKTTIDGSNAIFDTDTVFKVTRNGQQR